MTSDRASKWLLQSAAVLLCMVVFAADAFACPTCKDAISGSDPVSVARATGYFYSILFMMSMPFVIIGTFGSVAYLSIKRARAQQLGEQHIDAAKS